MKQHGDTADTGPAASRQERDRRAPITDRVNSEPAILNGMTVSEVAWVAGACFMVYGFFGMLMMFVTGWWEVALLASLFGAGGTVWASSLYLAKLKRGRPDGFYGQLIHTWISGRGLTKCRFRRHDSFWSVGRRMPGFATSLVVHERAAAPKQRPVAQRSKPARRKNFHKGLE